MSFFTYRKSESWRHNHNDFTHAESRTRYLLHFRPDKVAAITPDTVIALLTTATRGTGAYNLHMFSLRPFSSHSHLTFNPKNTVSTVKHGGVSIMLWCCLAASRSCPPNKANWKIKKEHYLQILQENLKASAIRVGLGYSWVLQQNNDPKHTSERG